MPKARKRKTPITAADTTDVTSSNPQASRTLIREFHTLIKRRAQLAVDSGNSVSARNALADVDAKVEALGGLSAYQRMSSIGQVSF